MAVKLRTCPVAEALAAADALAAAVEAAAPAEVAPTAVAPAAVAAAAQSMARVQHVTSTDWQAGIYPLMCHRRVADAQAAGTILLKLPRHIHST